MKRHGCIARHGENDGSFSYISAPYPQKKVTCIKFYFFLVFNISERTQKDG